MRKRKKKILTACVLAFLSSGSYFLPPAQALPTGFSSTTAVQTATDTTLEIAGMQANNVIHWNTFSIGTGESVTFDGKNYLNLVNGNARSEIYGSLSNPGGSLYLINPNGILFGSAASVNVGNLVASTRPVGDVDTAAFLAGGNPLTAAVDSVSGDITNLGTIQASSVTLEGNQIVLKSTADIQTEKSGKSEMVPLTGIAIRASGDVEIGYETDAEKKTAEKVNGTQYTDGNVSATYKASMLGYRVTDLGGTAKTAEDYMLVHNAYELQNMQNNPSGNYMLVASIDAAGLAYQPIADYSGTLNGLDYAIDGLTAAGEAGKNAGLVGALSGMVKNVLLTDVSITGTGNSSVGGVAGAVAEGGRIWNVLVTGSVTADQTAGTSDAGGIAGTNAGTIDTVWNQAVVTGGSHTDGGITGTNYATGVVTKAVNTASVTAESSSGVGGIVGLNRGGVNWAYNTGIATNTGTTTVSDDYTGSFAAGLTGRNTFAQYAKDSDVGTLENSVTTVYGRAAISVLEGLTSGRGSVGKSTTVYDEKTQSYVKVTDKMVTDKAESIKAAFEAKLARAQENLTETAQKAAAQKAAEEAARKAAEEAAQKAAEEAAQKAEDQKVIGQLDTLREEGVRSQAARVSVPNLMPEQQTLVQEVPEGQQLLTLPSAQPTALQIRVEQGRILVRQSPDKTDSGQRVLYIVGTGKNKHAEYRTNG